MRCPTGKVSFVTYEYAQEALHRIRSIPNKRVVPVRSYYCRYCEMYHLTSTQKRKHDEEE